MKNKNNEKELIEKEYIENVNHETAARPFSIHHTHVGRENPSALYMHCHPEAEFFYLEKGNITFFIEDKTYELSGGDLVFIPPNMIHYAKKVLGEACTYDALVFSLEWISGYLGGEGNLYSNTLCKYREDAIRVYHNVPEEPERIRSLLEFRNYAKSPIQSYEMRLLGELMIHLQDIFNEVYEMVAGSEAVDPSREGILKGIDYLMQHYDEQVTLSEVAAESGYSESYFCHRFKDITGYAPFAYLNRIRVIKASERLIISEDKVTKIATDCGFENISYFNRVFKKQMGVSPVVYRKNEREGRKGVRVCIS